MVAGLTFGLDQDTACALSDQGGEARARDSGANYSDIGLHVAMVTVWQGVPSRAWIMSIYALLMLSVLGALLLTAAVTDIRERIISNRLNAAIAILAVPWWFVAGLSGSDILIQVGLSAAVLGIFALCFAIGMMGGGDVKLLAALALWLPFPRMFIMLEWMALGGGVLTIGMLIAHRMRKAPGKPEIPYGVAIVGAALLILANDILTKPIA